MFQVFIFKNKIQNVYDGIAKYIVILVKILFSKYLEFRKRIYDSPLFVDSWIFFRLKFKNNRNLIA